MAFLDTNRNNQVVLAILVLLIVLIVIMVAAGFKIYYEQKLAT